MLSYNEASEEYTIKADSSSWKTTNIIVSPNLDRRTVNPTDNIYYVNINNDICSLSDIEMQELMAAFLAVRQQYTITETE